MPPIDLTVIVPTMNEAGNISPLVDRLTAAVADIAAEILFVDDSGDDTPAVISEVAAQATVPIRLLHRPVDERDGLSGAVVAGLRVATGRWVCVMDGDLQHPPEMVPVMMAAAQRLDADVVVASRRANVWGPRGLTFFRTVTSQSLTILARAMFPRSLKDVSDPLTGFFLMRRDQIDLEQLRPNGFKILLEILVRCPDRRITELQFDFAERRTGESKADFREGLRFFRHLMTLRLTAHQRPLGKYLTVGAFTFLLNNLIVWFLAGRAGWAPLVAVALATEAADLLSFMGNRRFVFPVGGGERKLGRFVAISQIFLLFLRLPLFALFFYGLDWGLLGSNVLAIGFTAAFRYLLSDRWIWTRDLLAHQRPLNYYDIHGLVAIESPIPLPDLRYFRVDHPPTEIDLRLRLDRHGTPRRTRDTIIYDDGLGRLGFAVTVYPLDGYAEVVASPLVQRSPAVLFSNIIEPLIKWLLLERQAIMVRASGIRDGHGGITLVMEQSGEQQSQEGPAASPSRGLLRPGQVILTHTGDVYPFTRPLKSRQTLNRPWMRRWGAQLRSRGVPVATVYTLVQWIFPPRLETTVPDEGPSGRLGRLDVGRPVDLVDAAALLLYTGRDPYGFPLLELLADRAGLDLAQKEGQILERSISHLKN